MPLPKPLKPKLDLLSRRSTERHCGERAESARSERLCRTGCKAQPQVLLITDTTMRDAHQSAVRDAHAHPPTCCRYRAALRASSCRSLLSLECWGGATFDVAHALPEGRPLAASGDQLRKAVPNIPFQMLLRSAPTLSVTPITPTTSCEYFVQAGGEERHRHLPRLRFAELRSTNMRVAMDAVIARTARLCEGTICYTGDLFDAGRPKYNLASTTSTWRSRIAEVPACPHPRRSRTWQASVKPRAARRTGAGAQI